MPIDTSKADFLGVGVYYTAGRRPRPGWRSDVASAPRPSDLRPVRQFPVSSDEVAGVAVRNALQIVLMLRFGFPEVTCWRHFRHDLARPEARRLDISNRVQGHLPLLLSGVEDG